MRGILIDPFTRTVSDVETDADLGDMYDLLQVDLITVVRMPPNHALILDDEGLLKSKEVQEYFLLEGMDQPLAGRGLILGDNYGENRDATLSLDLVRGAVTFPDKETINPSDWTGWRIEVF